MDSSVIIADLGKDAERHRKLGNVDGLLHNGSTVLVVLFTSCAALLPSWGEPYVGYAQVISIAAAVIVGVDRILRFGQRWAFHREMEYGYRSVLDSFRFAEILSDGKREAQVDAAMQRLMMYRAKEGGIPGGPTSEEGADRGEKRVP